MNAPFRLHLNPHHGVPGLVVLPESGFRRARAEIAAWPGHRPATPCAMPELAVRLGVAAVHAVIGEAEGAAYAVLRLLGRELALRGLTGPATAAALEAGQHREALRGLIIRADAGDEAVARACRRFGVVCAADTGLAAGALSSPGHTELPRDRMQGDRLLAVEALEALPAAPSHVFVAGRGMAVSTSVALRARGGAPPRLIVVEGEGDEPGLLEEQELERAAFATLVLNAARPIVGLSLNAAEYSALELGAGSRILLVDPACGGDASR